MFLGKSKDICSDASFNNIDINGVANIDKNATIGMDLDVSGKTTTKDISSGDAVLTTVY